MPDLDFPGKPGPPSLSLAPLQEEARVLATPRSRLGAASPPSSGEQSQLTDLVQAIQRLVAARDLPSIMAIVRAAARQLAAADGATFVLRDGDLCHYADEDAIAALWKGQRFPLSACISGWTMLHGEPAVIADIYSDPRIPVAAYAPTFVRSLVMTPIRTRDPIGAIGTYWATPTQPTAEVVAILGTLADATALAMENAQLYTTLEQRVHERTLQLEQSLSFEAALKRITDSVRDSLDEQTILQTARHELTQSLHLQVCEIVLPTASDRLTSSPAPPPLDQWPELALGGVCQVCAATATASLLPTGPGEPGQTVLVAPLVDPQGPIGTLWLARRSPEVFTEVEIRLVQQVANQCAIALRQSHLYQAAQTQVQELERLHQLKDDFLSTVSHELRSPLANIKLAIQMLTLSLAPLGVLTDDKSSIWRYFQILQGECEREVELIDNLLDMTRIGAQSLPVPLTPILLPTLVARLLAPFQARITQQHQTLQVQLTQPLPPVITHVPYLERILTELLTNACKHTPAGETITLAACPTAMGLTVMVINSGVEIPPTERDRIFEPFYRIPQADPWKHGGTGLGLALVQKLVLAIGASLRLDSGSGQTCFSLDLPIAQTSAQTSAWPPDQVSDVGHSRA